MDVIPDNFEPNHVILEFEYKLTFDLDNLESNLNLLRMLLNVTRNNENLAAERSLTFDDPGSIKLLKCYRVILVNIKPDTRPSCKLLTE